MNRNSMATQGKWIISLLGAIVVLLMVHILQSCGSRDYKTMYILKDDIRSMASQLGKNDMSHQDLDCVMKIPDGWKYEGTLMETEYSVYFLISK